jgi:NAD(P)-dependent dehydrogenase (short-subunit alcohol dehydrogenase family)
MKAIVTGANRGIGLELVKGLLGKGCEVTALCRQSSEELKGLNVQIIEGVDITQVETLQITFDKLKGSSFDLLINNAGKWTNESFGELSESGIKSIRDAMEINAYAPLRVTEILLPLLKAGSKIAFTTSRMGSISDNNSGGRYGYRMSKAALNMAAKSLSVDLKAQKIAVAILHPGYVKTRMTDFQGLITAEESAAGLIKRIEELNLETTGSFWHSSGEKLDW